MIEYDEERMPANKRRKPEMRGRKKKGKITLSRNIWNEDGNFDWFPLASQSKIEL
jgi:hypothetical protein